MPINFALKMSPAPTADDSSDSFWAAPGQTLTADRLRDFIPEAAELMRQHEAAQFGPQQHLNAARTALRLGRQVQVPAWAFLFELERTRTFVRGDVQEYGRQNFVSSGLRNLERV